MTTGINWRKVDGRCRFSKDDLRHAAPPRIHTRLSIPISNDTSFRQHLMSPDCQPDAVLGLQAWEGPVLSATVARQHGKDFTEFLSKQARGDRERPQDLATPASPVQVTVLLSSLCIVIPVPPSVTLSFSCLAWNDFSPSLHLASSLPSISLDYTPSSKPYHITFYPRVRFSPSDMTLFIERYTAYCLFPPK